MSRSLCLQCHVPCDFNVTFSVPSMSRSLWLQCHVPCASNVTFPVPSMSRSLCLQCHVPCGFNVMFPVALMSCSPWLQYHVPCDFNVTFSVASMSRSHDKNWTRLTCTSQWCFWFSRFHRISPFFIFYFLHCSSTMWLSEHGQRVSWKWKTKE